MRTTTPRLIVILFISVFGLLPLQSAQAVAVAETELSFLWNTLNVSGGVAGVDYAWDSSWMYYGAHSESQRNDAGDIDFQSNSTNPLNPDQPSSVLTTSGWFPATNGSAYLTQDDGDGNELARSRGYAYSDNTGDSFANGNSHWVRRLEIYTETSLTFLVDFQLQQEFLSDVVALENASGGSRPHIYIRDDYNGGVKIAEDFLEISNGLQWNSLYFSHNQSGTLSFTTTLALGNSGIPGLENIGLYTFEGHAHTSASATSHFAQSNPIPEPASVALLGLGLALIGFMPHFGPHRNQGV